MPGAECSIFGYTTCRIRTGVAIFGLPKGESELAKKTRNKWVRVITRNRIVEDDLRRQIKAGILHVCEKHLHNISSTI